ncbi:MAG: GNAT family N-acetyltransferase [Candidatus Acetothermia bacterium]|nr:GNAT family N-acetyltransferase [Candidatus Acetothermia bacterium]MDH7505958.1 GNAT family N-acetyltransferase [Candidatus Acetothermia bacterium]
MRTRLHYHTKRGYLGPAATLPEHRGKGLGKALTARAMNFLRERGLERVSLYTWEGNPPALRVTRGLDFRASHEWKILTKPIKGLP